MSVKLSMKSRVILISYITLALLYGVMALGQATLFIPVSTGVVKQVPLTAAINVMTDMSGAMQTPSPVAFGGAYVNVLLALPHQSDGDQALADCKAGKVPPQQGPLGTAANCSQNQQSAINLAMGNRVKAALAAIPTAVLQANDVEIIQ